MPIASATSESPTRIAPTLRRVSTRRRVGPSTCVAIAIIGLSVMLVCAGLATNRPASGAGSGQIRVNQAGYVLGEPKVAYLLVALDDAAKTFHVLDSRGRQVLSGNVGPTLGGWNSRYSAVHAIDFSSIDIAGTYHITVSRKGVRRGDADLDSSTSARGDGHDILGRKTIAVSPQLRIAGAAEVYPPIVAAMTRYFQAQRDGARVLRSVLDRKPSHLADVSAGVYAPPAFDEGGNLVGRLRRIGGPVDVEGGWFDGGDYVKYAGTTAYAVSNLLMAYRVTGETGVNGAQILAEAEHGMKWLSKMWDDRAGVLYSQVGLETGDKDGTIVGDRDVWRLPETDDQLAVSPGAAKYFLKYRPVFRDNEPGALVSPNLAGRVAGAFALAAQAHAATDRPRAVAELELGASLYRRAEIENPTRLVEHVSPWYSAEASWADDMEFGAIELALAGRALGDRRTDEWLDQAANWARAHLASDDQDSANLYDVSAFAHLDLAAALRAPAGLRRDHERRPGAAALVSTLLSQIRSELEIAVSLASDDPFRFGVANQRGDASGRGFGLVATAAWYAAVTGDPSFRRFALEQTSWIFGTNPWGTSLVIGIGTTYPRCPRHQIANLRGALVGAAVNGPNAEAAFQGSARSANPRRCPVDGSDPFLAMTGNQTRYRDDVTAWQSVDPAIHTTSTGLLAMTLLAP